MNYSKKFKEYPVEKLVKIVCYKEDYNDGAVEAAERELSERKINLEEYNTIVTKVQTNTSNNQFFQYILELPHKWKDAFVAFVAPRFDKEPSALIKGVAVFMLLYTIYGLLEIIKELYYTPFVFENLNLGTIRVWGATIAIPFMAYYFLWRLNNIGWYVSAMYCIYLSIRNGTLLFLNFYDGVFILNINLTIEVILWIIPCIFVYILYLAKVRRHLNIDNKLMWIVTLLACAYSIFLSISAYLYIQTILPLE